MNNLLAYNNNNNNTNDGPASRRYSGYPLNSTLVSSYTPDTIRSIISHAAAGQPYATAVWIRINRVGIQVNAQDPSVARSRVPVFIPIGLVHDIFMLPNINNIICIVYDELQTSMKGVLLYVVHPSDAQLLRDDFRIVKQASNSQQIPAAPYSSPFESRFTQAADMYPSGNNRMYTPTSPSKSPMLNDFYRNTVTVRQPSPRRTVHVRENEININQTATPTIPEHSFTPVRSSFHSGREDWQQQHKSPRRSQKSYSPSKRSNEGTLRRHRKHRSRSPGTPARRRLPISNSSHDLSSETLQQQQQWLMQQQQQQWFLQQQQQTTNWQAAQQAPPVPIGIYNRYVPKTIPLPTGEVLKTTLPSSGPNGEVMNGAAMAYIEPQNPVNIAQNIPSPLSSNSYLQQQQNRSATTVASPAYIQTTHHRHHSRHHRNHANDSTEQILKPDLGTSGHVRHTSRSRPKYSPLKDDNRIVDTDDETKQYLKMLVDEMQAMKLEMSKLRLTTSDSPRGRTDSLQTDLKEIRSHIDRLRARMVLTPNIRED
ncbi:unnamed protein product [Rotaria sordida]|uniref:Uncharacterized protein n=1 Tax=Rotaria sordida TaxID=392033 RepID=A0A819ILH4_9BILA|nr:unnamed protein product [Rotaria sordida]